MPRARAPSGEDGRPILGNTLVALKDPVRHVHAMYRKHGPVYRDHMFGVRSVVLIGPRGLLTQLRRSCRGATDDEAKQRASM